MSELEQLIQQYCPNGAEYKQLRAVIDIHFGERITKKDSLGTLFPVYGGGGESFRTDRYNREPQFVISRFAMSETCVRYAPEKFWLLDSGATYDVKDKDKADYKYVSHWLRQNQASIYACATQSAQRNLNTNQFLSLEIPLPPLPVQEEIVRILDSFTQLEAELEAELEARKAQYVYYRDGLLDFSSESPFAELHRMWCPRGVENKLLGDVGKFIRGNGIQKKDFVEQGFPCMHYGQIYTRYGAYAFNTFSFINFELAERKVKAKNGDLVIATTSENEEDVCKAVVWLGDGPVAISGDSYVYTHSMNPRYVGHFFRSAEFQNAKLKYITGTKVLRVSGDSMEKIAIPIPPLEVQQRIADILDSFDSLVNDLHEGIPAEIEARRQQYAYYRDALLSFKRLDEGKEQ